MMTNAIVMRSLRGYVLLFLMFLFVCCGKTSENNQNTEKEVEDTAEETKTSNENDDVDKNTILFFGDSLTAGLGLDTSEAYPALIQEKLDSLGYDYQVVNAGLSGDTTASGKSRIDWILKQDIDVFILELGANDGLRGIPLSETRKNLQDIIDIVKSKNPKTEIIIAGMQIPPNMGQDYTTEFKNIFPNLAKQNNVALIPFLLEDVAGNPDLNQNDGIHPTAEGYEIVSENVWEVLEGVLKKK